MLIDMLIHILFTMFLPKTELFNFKCPSFILYYISIFITKITILLLTLVLTKIDKELNLTRTSIIRIRSVGNLFLFFLFFHWLKIAIR